MIMSWARALFTPSFKTAVLCFSLADFENFNSTGIAYDAVSAPTIFDQLFTMRAYIVDFFPNIGSDMPFTMLESTRGLFILFKNTYI